MAKPGTSTKADIWRSLEVTNGITGSGCSTLPALAVPKNKTKVGLSAASACNTVDNTSCGGDLPSFQTLSSASAIPRGPVADELVLDIDGAPVVEEPKNTVKPQRRAAELPPARPRTFLEDPDIIAMEGNRGAFLTAIQAVGGNFEHQEEDGLAPRKQFRNGQRPVNIEPWQDDDLFNGLPHFMKRGITTTRGDYSAADSAPQEDKMLAEARKVFRHFDRTDSTELCEASGKDDDLADFSGSKRHLPKYGNAGSRAASVAGSESSNGSARRPLGAMRKLLNPIDQPPHSRSSSVARGGATSAEGSSSGSGAGPKAAWAPPAPAGAPGGPRPAYQRRPADASPARPPRPLRGPPAEEGVSPAVPVSPLTRRFALQNRPAPDSEAAGAEESQSQTPLNNVKMSL